MTQRREHYGGDDGDVWTYDAVNDRWAPAAAGAAGISIAGGASTAATGLVSFANSNSVTFGLSNGVMTASVAAGAGAGIGSVSGGTTRITAGELVLSNANGISWGVDGQTVTASHFRPVVSNALQDVGTATGGGTNTSRFAADDHVHRGVVGVVANGIATTFYGVVEVSAGNLMSVATGGASTAGSLQVVNLLSSSAIAQPVSSVSGAGTLSSRFALADHAHAGLNSISVVGNTAGATTAGAGSVVLAGGPNVTLSCATAAGGMTVSVSAASAAAGAVVSNAIQDVGTATGSGTNTSRFAADDHVHRGVLGVDVNGIASTFYGVVQLSAGNLMSVATGGASTRGTMQVVNLLSSSAIAQPVSSVSGAGTLSSRFALADHAHAGINSVSVVGNTAGATSAGAGSLVLAGGPNVTLSCGTVAGGMTVSVSAGAGGGAVVSNAIQSVGSATGSGTNTSRFAADDHVHAGLHLVSVVGNTAGATTAGAGSLVLAGGPNITLSCSTAAGGMTVSVSAGAGGGGGATLSGYENMPMLGAATTLAAPGLGSWYMQPFVLQNNLASGRLNAILISNSNTNAGVLRASNNSSFASNTTGTRSITRQDVWSAALYSRGAGANSTRIDSFWSNQWGLSITHQVSVILTAATQVRATHSASMAYVGAVGSDGGYTTAGITAGGSFSSAASSWNTSAISSVMASLVNMLTGQVAIPIGFNTSLGPGHYWLGVARSTYQTTAGSSIPDILPIVDRQWIAGISSMRHRPFGITVSNSSSQYFPGHGVYSAASSAPPSTMAFADIRSVANHLHQYFNIVNITV